MHVLIVRPTSAKFPTDAKQNAAYAEESFSHASRCEGVTAIRDVADVLDGTIEGNARAQRWVDWADVVRVYMDNGVDAAMILVERMAERSVTHCERVRINAFSGGLL
jgi:hypothetical protein